MRPAQVPEAQEGAAVKRKPMLDEGPQPVWRCPECKWKIDTSHGRRPQRCPSCGCELDWGERKDEREHW